jgi:hypothetical protein
MVILPYPEGAPGNILSVRAFFAGKPIVDFTDFRVCKGEFDTVGTPVSIIGPSHSASDELDFEYRLPDTMLDSVIERLQKSPEYVPEFNPLITALKTNKLEMLQNLDSSQTAAVEGFLNALYLKCRFMFTVSTADGEELKIRKDFMVRYNCRLQDIPGISRRLPVNNNPVI